MITIAIARDTDALDQTLSRLRLYFLLTILFADVAWRSGAVIVRRGLRPLHAIAEHAIR